MLQVSGSGFSKQSSVKIDGNVCEVQSYTYNSISCIIPSNAATSDKLVNVQVIDGAYTAVVPQQFTYDFTKTPVSYSKSYLYKRYLLLSTS